MKARTPIWTTFALVIAVALTFAIASPSLSSLFQSPAAQAASPEDDPALEVTNPLATSPTGTLHTLTLAPAAFVPQSSNMNWLIYGNQVRTTSGEGRFSANVILPQGAVVKKFTAYVTDKVDTGIINIALWRSSLMTYSSTSMAFLVSQTSPDNVRKIGQTSIGNPIIDNTNYSYTAEIWLSNPDVYVRAVKITYLY